MLRGIYDPPPLLYVKGNAELPETAFDWHRWHATPGALPESNGGEAGTGPRRAGAAYWYRIGAGNLTRRRRKGRWVQLRGRRPEFRAVEVEVIYPKENRKIFAEIEERGAIISEFPMGMFPAPQDFPIRNRIIAGMTRGVVVVEGAQDSGSLITARLAMEFSREAFAVPGNATQPASFGPKQLKPGTATAGQAVFESDAVTREKRRRKSSGIHGSFSGNR